MLGGAIGNLTVACFAARSELMRCVVKFGLNRSERSDMAVMDAAAKTKADRGRQVDLCYTW
jgi:hypothetical protein